MTGLTLPGMIDEPGCIGGRLISLSPQRGPDESQRRSLQILEICTAARFIVAGHLGEGAGVLGGFDQVRRLRQRQAGRPRRGGAVTRSA